MHNNQSIRWFGVVYPVVDVKLVVSTTDHLLCPNCIEGELLSSSTDVWLHGVWDDTCIEFCTCDTCAARVAVRSHIIHDEGLPFDLDGDGVNGTARNERSAQ